MRTLLKQGLDNYPVGGVPAGTFAIYDSGPDGLDDRPAQNPKKYMSRVHLHSALDYMGVVAQLDTVLTFPAVSYFDPVFSSRWLYDHHRGDKPMAIHLISFDGVNYGAMNGDLYSLLGNAFLGRRLNIQCDADSFYLAATEYGGLPGETIYFRTLVLDRAFDGLRQKTDEIYFKDGRQIRAAGGLFDTSRRYLQTPAPGQSGAFAHFSGQTLFAIDGDEAGEIDIEIINSVNFANICQGIVAASGGPLYSVPGTVFGTIPAINYLVPAGPETLATTLERTPDRIRISGPDGEDVFDTARAIVTFVGEYNETIALAAHGAGTLAGEVPHEIIHAQIPLEGDVDLILGWGQITSAAFPYNLETDKPFDLSGSVILFAGLKGNGSAIWVRRYSTLSARVVAGNLEIVETYFNFAIDAGTDAIPAMTVDVRIFACALAGGNGATT